MIGVVLWSNGSRQKAVIWCEDNGALAYLRSATDFNGAAWPQAGDLVSFEPAEDGALRVALAVERIPGRSDLPARLAPTPGEGVRLTAVPDLPARKAGADRPDAAQSDSAPLVRAG